MRRAAWRGAWSAWAVALILGLVGCYEEAKVSTSSGGESTAAPPPVLPSVTRLSRTGFVWKPVSEGDGRLVVLLPASFDTVAVVVNTESGRFVGRTNGDRPTYRFSRPGASYPAPSVLTIGQTRYGVPNPGQRYD